LPCPDGGFPILPEVLAGDPGVVPCVEVVEQLRAQPVTPRQGVAIRRGWRATGPGAPARSRGLLFLFGENPPDAVSTVVPVNEHSARPGHAARIPPPGGPARPRRYR
jgi:hypothetical protein